jgi:hypothetical protein
VRAEAVCLALGLLAATGAAAELDLRLKAFGSAQRLPQDDALRDAVGTPAYDGSLDLRTLFATARDRWRVTADHSLILESGDSFAFARSPLTTLDQTPTDDERRLFDLTWTLEDGDRHRTLHRFDRLALDYRGDGWGFSVGRRAVSWGGGIVFQPLDLFAPFAPTTVDRDYKPGEDVLLLEKLNPGGSDLQLLGVFRRDEAGQRDADAGSLGGKWHGHVGPGEVEVVAGRHYQDRVAGGSLRLPLGGAMARADLLVTDVHEAGTVWSAVLNVDYTLTVGARNVYLFGELFRNGFGVGEDSVDLLRVPERLRLRLARGEVFNLMRRYAAVGGTVEWHPLLTQSLTVIGNLDDGSALLQSELRWLPTDAIRLDAGFIDGRGSRGDEFGALPLPVAGEPTTGGGTTAYLRFVYFL